MIWSRRQLVVDCLSHHFTTTQPSFHVVSSSTYDVDLSGPVVCIRDIEHDHYSKADKRRAVDEIEKAAPGARVLIFSDSRSNEEARDWIEVGANGFFSKRATPALLTASVMLVAAGGIFLPEDLVRSLANSSWNSLSNGL